MSKLEWKSLSEAFGPRNSNVERRMLDMDHMRIKTGLSYRELLEDVLELVDNKQYDSIHTALRRKYGFIG